MQRHSLQVRSYSEVSSEHEVLYRYYWTCCGILSATCPEAENINDFKKKIPPIIDLSCSQWFKLIQKSHFWNVSMNVAIALVLVGGEKST